MIICLCTYRACWLGWYGLTELFANFAKFEQKESQFVHLQGWKTETEFRDDFCLQLRTYPESDRGLVLSWVSGRQRKDSLLWLDLSISPGLIFFSSELLVGESELLSARGPLLLKRKIKIIFFNKSKKYFHTPGGLGSPTCACWEVCAERGHYR